MEEVKVVKQELDSLKQKSVEEKQFKFNTEVTNKFNQIWDRAGADDMITDNQNNLISTADRDGWE